LRRAGTPGVDGPIVWIACECAAGMARQADEGERVRVVSWTPAAAAFVLPSPLCSCLEVAALP
jgi:hypothetical protein